MTVIINDDEYVIVRKSSQKSQPYIFGFKTNQTDGSPHLLWLDNPNEHLIILCLVFLGCGGISNLCHDVSFIGNLLDTHCGVRMLEILYERLKWH